jgi:transposase
VKHDEDLVEEETMSDAPQEQPETEDQAAARIRKERRLANKQAKEQRRKEVLARTLTCEIAKPLNRTWDELGSTLRGLAAVAHRCIQASTLEYAHALQSGRKPNGYEAGKMEVDSFLEWVTTHKDAKVKERFAALIEGGVPGGTVSAWDQIAKQSVQRWLKERRSTRLPSMGKGAPVALRRAELDITLEDNRPVLSMTLDPGRKQGKIKVALMTTKGPHWSLLRQVAAGELEMGGAKILTKDGKKWMVLLSVFAPKTPAKDVDQQKALVVHRGMHNFITCMSTEGHFRKLIRGNKLRAQKQSLAARRRDMGMVSPYERGDGAKGHGRDRRFDAVSRIEDLEARVVKTACQQAASAVVELAKLQGCGSIVIEQYGGIGPDEDRNVRRFLPRFPYYQLKAAIDWACKKSELALVEIEQEYISCTCPRCNVTDTAAHNTRTGIFHCRACSFHREADFVAALHMLRRSGFNPDTWNKRLKQEEDLAAALREQAAE